MARTSNVTSINGMAVFPLQPILQRINRRLNMLIPYRGLYYKRAQKDYYIRIVEQGHPDHLSELGPVYYSNMIALADHLDLWMPSERGLGTRALQDMKGNIFTQDPVLPEQLQFKVVSHIYADAMAALRREGWTLTPPDYASPQLVLPAPALQLTNYKLDDAVPEECMPHSPREHHPMCNSWHGGECDCGPFARDGLEPA